MVDFEKDPSFWDEVGWQHYQRFRQFKQIEEELVAHFADRYKDQSRMSEPSEFDIVLVAPTPLLDLYLRGTGLSKQQFYQKAADSLRDATVEVQIGDILEGLEQVLTTKGQSGNVILTAEYPIPVARLIGVRSFTIPDILPVLKNNLREEVEVFESAVREGRIDAVNLVLERLQRPSSPLMYYDLVLGHDALPLENTESGGFRAQMPSILDGVSVEFVYEAEKRQPDISLLISPILIRTVI